MKRCAWIENGTVVNVIEADAAPEGWIACGDAGPGWTTADGGITFTAPAAPAPVRHITPRALRMRFTSAERVAIEIGMLDDPTAAMAVRQQAAALRAYMGDLAAAQYIDLDDPATVSGVQMLETAGLIATGRAAAILSQDPQPGELP